MQEKSTYQQLDLETRIILHLTYRDIFNAPVKKKDLLLWLGLKENETNFVSTLSRLKVEENIEEIGEYLCIAGRSNLVKIQSKKTSLTKQILEKRKNAIRFWLSMPFVHFVGLSGSLAAQNPTIQNTGIVKDSIDIDLFVITAPNTMWLIFFFQRLFHWIRLALGLMPKHFLCINYVMEAPNLEIYNKNFYTATELTNLKNMNGESVYSPLLAANTWQQHYYPRDNTKTGTVKNKPSKNYLLAPVNYLFFIIAQCVIAAKDRKKLSWNDFSRQFRYEKSYNYRRIAGRNGGFQEQIMLKFKQTLEQNFPNYYDDKLMELLFPTEFSPTAYDIVSKRDAEKMDAVFSKYEKV